MTPELSPVDAKVGATEVLISRVLRAGVTISFVFIVVGTTITFARHPDYLADHAATRHLTDPGANFPHSLGAVLTGVVDLRGQAIVALGLLVLMITPPLRVAISIVLFAHERDRAFVAITSVVLTLLVLSLALGRAVA